MLIWTAVFAAVGYAAAVFTWPTIRRWINGAEAEAQALRAKARAIEDAIRGRAP